MTPFLGECLVLENRPLAEAVYLLRLKAPAIAHHALPGQFVLVKTGPGPERGGGPLLKRPFSLHRIGPGDEIALLYKVVGIGTELLSNVSQGYKLEVFGPLGHGFERPEGAPMVYMVAGGIGLAPLLALSESLYKKTEITLFYGVRTKAELVPVSHLNLFHAKIRLTSDDGTSGQKGFVTDPLSEAMEHSPAPLFACGPEPMLAEVAGLAKKHGVKAQLSLEARMACGLGACLGCVCRKSGEGYSRVCLDGPVFPAEAVLC